MASTLMMTDWFKVNYHVINWTTPRQVDIVAIARGPIIDSGSQSRFQAVTSLASLASYPEFVPVKATVDPTVDGVGFTFYLRDGTPTTGESLQLVYNPGTYTPANIEDDAGWSFNPTGPATVVQETMAGAVYYLVGTYSGVVNPVLFYMTQGVGDFTIIHDDSLYGQTNTSAPAGDENILSLDTTIEGTAAKTISTVARTSNVATIVTTTAHGLDIGSVVVVTTSAHAAWNGTVIVTTVPTSTSFTYANTGANQAAVADAGTVAYKAVAFSAAYTLLIPGLPPWEGAHAHHLWLEPQRVNLIANPSFEHSTPTMYWRASTGTLTRVAGGVDALRPNCGRLTGGATTKVLESNLFPVVNSWLSASFHIAALPSAGSATMKWGVVCVDPTYGEAVYISSEDFPLAGGSATEGFVEFRGLIPIPVNMAEMCFRIEVTSCTTLWVDNVLADPHEGQYAYFDGNSIEGLPNDFRWMGGEGDAHFSLWYNNYQNTRYRLMGDYDTVDDVYKPGLVEEWAPTGANIQAHWDAVTSFTPANWEGDAYYPLAQISGTPVSTVDTELDFWLVPKP